MNKFLLFTISAVSQMLDQIRFASPSCSSWYQATAKSITRLAHFLFVFFCTLQERSQYYCSRTLDIYIYICIYMCIFLYMCNPYMLDHLLTQFFFSRFFSVQKKIYNKFVKKNVNCSLNGIILFTSTSLFCNNSSFSLIFLLFSVFTFLFYLDSLIKISHWANRNFSLIIYLQIEQRTRA